MHAGGGGGERPPPPNFLVKIFKKVVKTPAI